MRLHSKHFGLALAAAAMLAGCSTPKDITYMQGFSNEAAQAVREQRRITVQPDDKLSIIVSSKDPALAEVFNLAVAQYRVGYNTSNQSQQASAFTVTPDGDVDYPILGPIHVAGLNRHEVSKLIEERLEQSNLLKDPVVTVEFLNATVAVLGDVTHPGEYPIDKDNMTILQALSKAGDLAITGMRTNVLVVREENGQDRAYRLDLTNTQQLMQSPAYYLRQNDVVYVEPNATRKRQANANGNTVLTPTFWLSVASLLATITALLIK